MSPATSVDAGSHYVALGSSFAAGPGIEPILDATAGRSGNNYAHLVAEHAGLTLTDVSCSGATTRALLQSTRPIFHPSRRPAAQLEAVTEDTALVSLTIGGNDVGYLGGLIKASALNLGPGRVPILGALLRPMAGRLGRIGTDPEALGRLADSLSAAIVAAHGRAPAARIMLVDYLSVAGGPEPAPTIPLSPTQWRQAQVMARALTAVFTAVVERARAAEIQAELIDTATPSRSHHAGSAEPWVTGWLNPRAGAPYHPNAAGMAAVAELILARL